MSKKLLQLFRFCFVVIPLGFLLTYRGSPETDSYYPQRPLKKVPGTFSLPLNQSSISPKAGLEARNEDRDGQRVSVLHAPERALVYIRTEGENLDGSSYFYYQGRIGTRTMLELINRPLKYKEDILKRQEAVDRIMALTREEQNTLQELGGASHQWIGYYRWLLENVEISDDRSEQRLIWMVEQGLINPETLDENMAQRREEFGGWDGWTEISDLDKAYLFLALIRERVGKVEEFARAIEALDSSLLKGLANELRENMKVSDPPSPQALVTFSQNKDREALSEVLERLENVETAVSNIAAFITFATLAQRESFARATFDENRPAYYKGGWLLIEDKQGQIPNDGPRDINSVVLTGSNMSGKSHYLKQNFFIQRVGQAFGYVPAQEANLWVYDHMVYLDRPSTDTFQNLSAFGKEIKNWIPVEKQAGQKTFVFVDEGYSTTSPEDQAEFLKATQQFLESQGARMMIATHNEDYIESVRDNPNVALYHFEVEVHGEEIRFTFLLRDGPDDSRAIEVAQVLGLQESVLDRAKAYHRGEEKPVTDIRRKSQIPVKRYTEAERQALKKKSGNFLSFFPREDTLDIIADREGDTKYILDNRGRVKWRHGRLDLDESPLSYRHGDEPEAEPYPFDPVFIRLSEDDDFRPSFSPMRYADYGKVKNQNLLSGIQALMIHGPSRDPREIYERQHLFHMLSTLEDTEFIQEPSRRLVDLMSGLSVWRGWRDEIVDWERFNLEFLKSAVLPQRESMISPPFEEYKLSVELFLEILQMNCNLAHIPRTDLDSEEEIRKIKALLLLYDELETLRKFERKHRDEENIEGIDQDTWVETVYLPKIDQIISRFVTLTGRDMNEEPNRGFWIGRLMADFSDVISNLARTISEKAFEKIPPVSLYDRNRWDDVRREIERLYPFVDQLTSRDPFYTGAHLGGVLRLSSLLSEEDRVQELLDALRRIDSVHLHQWSHYFEEILRHWFGETRRGIDYLEEKVRTRERVKELEDEILEFKERQKRLKSETEDREIMSQLAQLEWDKERLEERKELWQTPLNERAFLRIREEFIKLQRLLALAYIIQYQQWHPVELTNESIIEMEEGWNVVKSKKDQVSLSVRMDDQERVRLYSGSNMSGKTFAEKTLVWNVLAGLASGYAPNVKMKLPILDRVIYLDRVTRQYDRTLSAFGHEISYWKAFFQFTQTDGLVLGVIDEAASTTSPRYQAALSYAFAEEFLEEGHLAVMASHNHDFLNRFMQSNERYANIYHFRTRVDKDGQVIFDYVIEPGHALSNSIQIAKALGLKEIPRLIEEGSTRLNSVRTEGNSLMASL